MRVNETAVFVLTRARRVTKLGALVAIAVRKVWVVDDSPLDAEHARRTLGEAYAVEVFPDGSAVLERLATGETPDVVICDWMMPGVTGVDVCRFIRRSPLPQVPVLLLTARHSVEQIVEGLAAGANDYVAKPYSPPELLARVGALIRHKELTASVEAAQRDVSDLIESSPDPLLGVGPDGRVRVANQAAVRMFGESQGELHAPLRDRQIAELLPGLSLPKAPEERPLQDLVVRDRIFSATVRSTGSGSITVALRDVTERRRAEAKRLDLYAIIAHDMRSPLQALLLRVDMLTRGRRGPLPADIIGELQRIDTGLRSLVSMINDFLELAKLGASAARAVPVDVRELVSTAFEELKPLADARGLAIAVTAPGPAPVRGDPRLLLNVFTNLVGNAIKFTDPGGRISATVNAPGGFVEVEVADTGKGIPTEALPTIFNRFTRVAGAESVVGSGLGLMIVREIVEAHGGRVSVRSTLGQGSTFSVRLPSA